MWPKVNRLVYIDLQHANLKNNRVLCNSLIVFNNIGGDFYLHELLVKFKTWRTIMYNTLKDDKVDKNLLSLYMECIGVDNQCPKNKRLGSRLPKTVFYKYRKLGFLHHFILLVYKGRIQFWLYFWISWWWLRVWLGYKQ